MKYEKKAGLLICLLALLLLSGCRARNTFDGSMTADSGSFELSYAMLDQEQAAGLTLTAGDRLLVRLSHTDGSVDVTVGQPGKEPIYRGNGQANAEFALEIAESGVYHISVTGHRAVGQASFLRASADPAQENP